MKESFEAAWATMLGHLFWFVLPLAVGLFLSFAVGRLVWNAFDRMVAHEQVKCGEVRDGRSFLCR